MVPGYISNEGKSAEEAVIGPVFIHLSSHDFEGIYMGDSNQIELSIELMIPKRSVEYFVTVQGKIYLDAFVEKQKMPKHF